MNTHFLSLKSQESNFKIKKIAWISFAILFGIVFLLSQNFFAQADEPNLPDIQLTKSIEPATVFPDGTTRVTLGIKGTGESQEQRSPVDVMHTIDISGSMDWYGNIIYSGEGNLSSNWEQIDSFEADSSALDAFAFDVLLITNPSRYLYDQHLRIKSPSGKWYGYQKSSRVGKVYRRYEKTENIRIEGSNFKEGIWEIWAEGKNNRAYNLAVGKPPVRIDAAKEAAKDFIDIMQTNDKIGVISFSNKGRLKQKLTSLNGDINRNLIKDKINNLDAGGATAIGKGIDKAIDELNKNGREYLTQAIILLTDGMETENSNPLGKAERAKDKGIIIYTIGFGEADKVLLKDIADLTGGESYYADNTGQLEGIYNLISQEFSDVAASGTVLTDILPDYIEYAGNATTDPDEIIENLDGTTTLIWNLGKIKIGDEFSVSFDVKVHKESGTHLVDAPNSRVDFYNYLGEPDSKKFPETFVNVISDEEPYIFKANNPDGEVSPGDEIEFTLTYSNNSDSVKTFDIVDTWSFLTDIVASYVDGSASNAGDIEPVIDAENQTITWKDIELPAKTIDQILNFKLRFHETHPNEGTFTLKNIAAIIFNEKEYQSDETVNTVAYEEATPEPEPSPCPSGGGGGGGVYIPPIKKYSDLTVAKTDGQETADPGQTLEYSVTYANIGDTEAKNVEVIDILPDFVKFISASDNGVYDSEKNQVVWSLGNILAGVSKILNLQVEVFSETPAEGAALTNKVEIKTTSEDSDLSNNQAEDITNIGAVKGAEKEPEGKVEAEEILPEAGAEFSIILLMAMIVMGIAVEIKERLLINKNK